MFALPSVSKNLRHHRVISEPVANATNRACRNHTTGCAGKRWLPAAVTCNARAPDAAQSEAHGAPSDRA